MTTKNALMHVKCIVIWRNVEIMNAVYCGKVRIGLSSNNYNYDAKKTGKTSFDNEFRNWASDIIPVRGLVRVYLPSDRTRSRDPTTRMRIASSLVWMRVRVFHDFPPVPESFLENSKQAHPAAQLTSLSLKHQASLRFVALRFQPRSSLTSRLHAIAYQ